MNCSRPPATDAESGTPAVPDPDAVEYLFARASVRLWEDIAQDSRSDWTAKMAQAARA